MRYIDWSHAAGRYTELAKLAGATEMQESWIDGAEAVIDARLALKYTVPFANTPTLTPPVIRDLAIDLTYYKAMLGKKQAEALGKDIEARFTSLLNGTMIVTDASGAPLDDGASLLWTDRAGYHSSFGSDDPVEYDISSRWMESSRNSRGEYP
jgi:hypothetical protein